MPLELLERWADQPGQVRFYDVAERIPLEGVVPAWWRDAVVDEHGRVERIPYELCVLKALREAIRRREVWVAGANRWRDPEQDLPQDFDANRDVHYAAICQPLDPTAFVASLQQRLGGALGRLDRALADGSAGGVRITTRRRAPWITVPPIDKQPEPPTLQALKDEVERRWGTIDLLDMLKDADYLTGFTDEFVSVASREVTDRATLRRRLLLVCFGLGTNMGVRRVVAAATATRRGGGDGERGAGAGAGDGQGGEHGETEAMLRRVRRLYVNRDNLRRTTAPAGQRHLRGARQGAVGPGHRLRQRLQEIRRLAVQPDDRMACPLRRRGRDDLLARRTPIGLYLLAAQGLLGVGGRGDDRGGIAPPHLGGGRPQLRRHPRRQRRRVRVRPPAGLPAAAAVEEHRRGTPPTGRCTTARTASYPAPTGSIKKSPCSPRTCCSRRWSTSTPSCCSAC